MESKNASGAFNSAMYAYHKQQTKDGASGNLATADSGFAPLLSVEQASSATPQVDPHYSKAVKVFEMMKIDAYKN
ncbi:MAG: hypothetical protein JNL58_00040 [Planctomyces sp.]|nr:hypothetical protein [Planctomyces sp.]